MSQTFNFPGGRSITLYKGKVIARVGFIEPAEMKKAKRIYKEIQNNS